VVILAKDATCAKTRLLLPPDQARHVAVLLAAATVRTVLSAQTVGAVLVVTSDPAIAVDALQAGADVVVEPYPLGMNRAAALVRRHAIAARPTAPVAIMVADLPRLTARDIDRVVEAFWIDGRPLFVTDRAGLGTTFMIHGPDCILGIGFGHNSASMHRRLGYGEALEAPSGLRTDLDCLEDLDHLGECWFASRPCSRR
jgi:2-phospho-L-lactate guanylyltransferase